MGLLTKCLPPALPSGLRTKSSPPGPCREWLERGTCTTIRIRSALTVPPTNQEVGMTIIIGIDPHKATHTAVAIGSDESELATVTIRATRQQTDKLLSWAEPFEERTWAIESAGGLGYLLAEQIVRAGGQARALPVTHAPG